MIEVFSCGPVATNTLVVYCAKTKDAVIVDPSLDSISHITASIEKHALKPTKILLTHSHWDHIADLKELAEKYSLDVYVHPNDAPNVEHPGSDGLISPVFVAGHKPSHFINEGDVIKVGTIDLKVIETPGHTPGGVCFYIEKEHLLISGDTLFQGSYGRLDLPQAKKKPMIASLKKLSKLPPDTVVVPGHGPQTSIGKESWIQHPEIRLNS